MSDKLSNGFMTEGAERAGSEQSAPTEASTPSTMALPLPLPMIVRGGRDRRDAPGWRVRRPQTERAIRR